MAINSAAQANRADELGPIYKTLPWVQDTVAQKTWDRWAINYRDVVVVDAFSRPVAKDNLTQHDLGIPVNRAALVGALVRAATPVDSDKDQLPDDWEIGWFGSLAADPNADPDGDGASNLTEFIFATNPVDPKLHPAFLPFIAKTSGKPALSVVFRRFVGGAADFMVETSADAVTWTTASSDLLRPVMAPLYDGFGGAQVRFQQTTTAGARPAGFIRVRPVAKLPAKP